MIWYPFHLYPVFHMPGDESGRRNRKPGKRRYSGGGSKMSKLARREKDKVTRKAKNKAARKARRRNR